MRLTVGTKCASLSILAIALTLGAALFGLVQRQTLSAQTLRLAANTQASQHAHALQLDLQQVYSALDAGSTQQNLAWFGQPLQEPLTRVAEDVTGLTTVLAAHGESVRAAEISATHRTLTEEVTRMVTLATAGEWNTAYLRLANYVEPTKTSFDVQIQEIAADVRAEVATARQAVAAGEQAYIRQVLLGTLLAIVLLGGTAWLLWRNVVLPIRQLTASATQVAQGDLAVRTQMGSRADEVGTLAAAFDHMTSQLAIAYRGLEDTVQQRTAELAAERTALQHALTELQASTAEREVLTATLAQIHNPVIPVTDNVVVAPIVGELTGARLAQLQRTILDTVTTTEAQVVLLDITGVPELDEAGVTGLLQINQALALVGASAMMVGIRPEVAERLVAFGTNVSSICTATDLQRGIDLALRQVRQQRVRGGATTLLRTPPGGSPR